MTCHYSKSEYICCCLLTTDFCSSIPYFNYASLSVLKHVFSCFSAGVLNGSPYRGTQWARISTDWSGAVHGLRNTIALTTGSTSWLSTLVSDTVLPWWRCTVPMRGPLTASKGCEISTFLICCLWRNRIGNHMNQCTAKHEQQVLADVLVLDVTADTRRTFHWE